MNSSKRKSGVAAIGQQQKSTSNRQAEHAHTSPVFFEDFESDKDWILVVALEHTYFNIYEHKDGARNALEGYEFPYRDLFQWNVKVNYELEPGQAVFFRPWLFHSFTGNLVQIFRLRDI